MFEATNSNLLTVVVTTRNRPGLLTVALRSIHAAFGPATEVIIGDNGDGAVTAALLEKEKSFGLRISHRVNPSGSSYTDNVQILFDACATPWLTLLHDDDFFVGHAPASLLALLADPAAVFVFPDHWVARNDGTIDESVTVENSERYGRARLATGPVRNLALLAIQNSICLDGFFVRTAVARRRRLDRTLPLFAQNKWMIEVCSDCSGAGFFLKERVFAYRLTAGSLTSQGMNNLEILEAMLRTELPSGPIQTAMNARIRAEWWSAFKASVKRATVWNFLVNHSPLRILTGRRPARASTN